MTYKEAHSTFVLNTRPRTQAKSLTTELEKNGFHVIEQPTLEIKATRDFRQIKQAIARLSTSTTAVFISQHAVRAVSPYWLKDKSATLVAIGPSTQEAISKYLGEHGIMPASYSTEGLADMPVMSCLHKRQVIIFGSNHINHQLNTTLQHRAERVEHVVTYVTTPVEIDSLASLDHLKSNNLQVLIATSQASLKQLHKWYYPHDSAWLLSRDLLVISEKIHALALKLGWKKSRLLMSKNATTAAIVKTIRSC